MNKIIVPIRGMHCKSCELLIEEEINKISEVEKVDVSHVAGRVKVWFQGRAPSRSVLSRAIQDAGYEIGDKDNLPWFSRSPEDYKQLFNAAVILLLIFILAKWFSLGSINVNIGEKSIAMAGVIGLVAGFSSCMALIGGLVLGLSARHSELHPEASRMEKFRPHIFFNLGRVLGFAFFGGLIGLLGSALQPSVKTLGIMTIVVGGVMIFLGLKLIEIFPVLRDKNITLPKFISRALGIHKENKEYSHRGAFISGALSFFLPCGFTQAMQLYAISTGSFVQGALIMSLFALGTAPGLLGLGGLSSAFKGRSAKLFFATAGLAVITLGIFNITNASRLVFPSIGSSSDSEQNYTPAGGSNAAGSGEVQLVKAQYAIDPGLSPKTFTVKAGQPVRFEINVLEEDYGCMGSIMIPGVYQKALFMNVGTTVMEFTPKKKGNFKITCAMGLPHGTLRVE
jgi:uncharacterized protein